MTATGDLALENQGHAHMSCWYHIMSCNDINTPLEQKKQASRQVRNKPHKLAW